MTHNFPRRLTRRPLLPYALTGCLLFALLLAPAHAQAQTEEVVYDFNHLTGSDTAPYTTIAGQDNWTTTGFAAFIDPSGLFVGVTASLGFDGSPALRFSDVGSGVGADASRINDDAFSLPTFSGNETNAVIELDMGETCWGSQFALGYDADGNGELRRTNQSELGPQLFLGTGCNDYVGLQAAAGGDCTTVDRSVVGGPGRTRRLVVI